MKRPRKVWLWRAWSQNRERICDSGIALAHDADDARGIAVLCVGGPHRFSVREIAVEQVRDAIEEMP